MLLNLSIKVIRFYCWCYHYNVITVSVITRKWYFSVTILTLPRNKWQKFSWTKSNVFHWRIIYSNKGAETWNTRNWSVVSHKISGSDWKFIINIVADHTDIFLGSLHVWYIGDSLVLQNTIFIVYYQFYDFIDLKQ